MLDSLLESHGELCATLRQVGRQLLHIENRGDHSLDKIRSVLKRAENLRRTLRISSEMQQGKDELFGAAETSDFESNPGNAATEAPSRETVQKKGRLTRPRSFDILKFPSG